VGVCDEIIIVDSHSTDDTESICKGYNANFVQRAFTDYADQKNYGNSLAVHPFILSIDADEVLSETLRNSILAIKDDLADDVYAVNRRNNYCGQWINHSGWYPDRKWRMWRKSVARWEGQIHEILVFESDRTKRLKGDLLHYSYPSIENHGNKINYFSTLGAQDLFEKNRKASYLNLIFNPVAAFIKMYFVKQGFRDGYYGFVIAIMSAYGKFYKYAKLKDSWKRHNADQKKRAKN
jgi:glycosyltransferase involved in cell wall biosynthesis